MELQTSCAKARQQQQQEVDARRLQKHVAVALALRDPARAPQVVKSALEQVRLWQEKQLCSRDYIDAWVELLNDPAKAAAVLEDESPFAVQMRQNAPFVSHIRGLDHNKTSPSL